MRKMFPFLLATVSAITSGTAMADGLSVTRTGDGRYDVDVPDPASAADVLQAIAEATGATVSGEPSVTDVARNRLHAASLQRVVSVLLPRAAFVIRYAADGAPARIIFLTPPGASANEGQ